MINRNECARWHSQFLPCLVKLQCIIKCLLRLCTLTWKYCFFYLLTRANAQNTMKFDGREVKALARQTNNEETISWTKKRRQIQSTVRTLHKILHWFAWDFCLPRVQPLIFCYLFQCQSFLQTIVLKHVIYAKICREAKLQAFVKMQMTRNQSKTFQKELYFRSNLLFVSMSEFFIF